jgi:hypothetical protein
MGQGTTGQGGTTTGSGQGTTGGTGHHNQKPPSRGHGYRYGSHHRYQAPSGM